MYYGARTWLFFHVLTWVWIFQLGKTWGNWKTPLVGLDLKLILRNWLWTCLSMPDWGDGGLWSDCWGPFGSCIFWKAGSIPQMLGPQAAEMRAAAVAESFSDRELVIEGDCLMLLEPSTLRILSTLRWVLCSWILIKLFLKFHERVSRLFDVELMLLPMFLPVMLILMKCIEPPFQKKKKKELKLKTYWSNLVELSN